MNKDELKQLIIVLLIGILVLIPLFKYVSKEDKKAIETCMNKGYSESYCSDFKR